MRTALLVVLTGCSFFATEGPRPPPGPTRCNRDMKAPTADAISSIGAALAAGVASTAHAHGAEVPALIGVAGVFGASSGYGYFQVRRCRAEHEKRPAWSLDEMPAVM